MSSQNRVRIRPLRDNDVPCITSLLDAPGAKSNLWRWQFTRTPRLSLVAETAAGDIVGFNGAMPVNVCTPGITLKSAWSCDFIVAESERGKGVGKLLKESLQDSGLSLLAFGISDAGLRVHQRMGWRSLKQPIFSIVRYNSASDLKQWALRLVQITNRSLSLFSTPVSVNQIMVNELDADLVAKLADCWTRAKSTWDAAIDRDYDYLSWRYLANPIVTYDVIWKKNSEHECQAALVIRRSRNRAAIVDYIGPCHEKKIKAQLTCVAVSELSEARSVYCRTTDSEMRNAILQFGAYQPRRTNNRFSVWQQERNNRSLEHKNWLLMPGDSDGEILEAASENQAYKVRRLDSASMNAMKAEWSELLANSTCDKMFLSWTWVTAWWSSFSERNNLSLYLFAAYSPDNQLIGIAPLYQQTVDLPAGIASKRIQMIGNIWRGSPTVRSEYLRFIALSGHEEKVAEAFISRLALDPHWDDFVIADTPDDDTSFKAMTSIASTLGYARRASTKHDPTYEVDCRGSINKYLESLSSTTRRRLFRSAGLFGKRHGIFSLEFANRTNCAEYLAELNSLHALRWGKPVFADDQLTFALKISRACSESDQLYMSRIVSDGKTRSVLMNLRVGNRLYNLQGGFDPHFDKRIPLGYMHLGLTIRECFESDIEFFDLLAGDGKNTNFKEAFASPRQNLTVFQLVRRPFRKVLYRLRDHLLNSHRVDDF